MDASVWDTVRLERARLKRKWQAVRRWNDTHDVTDYEPPWYLPHRKDLRHFGWIA